MIAFVFIALDNTCILVMESSVNRPLILRDQDFHWVRRQLSLSRKGPSLWHSNWVLSIEVFKCPTYSPPIKKSCWSKRYTVVSGFQSSNDWPSKFKIYTVSTILYFCSPQNVVPLRKLSWYLKDFSPPLTKLFDSPLS